MEHFFRHEFGRLGAVLTRSLGVRRLDHVEDVVQAALVQAQETWSRRGVPEDPAGWLYRTARNLAIDALRRERTHAQALPRLAEDNERESSPLEAHFADEIGDEPLRLLFVCCHAAVPAESRVALALRTLCGFSTAEIARALLTTDANVQKRIERARDRLRELDVDFGTPAAAQLCARLDAVLAVVYLLFSQISRRRRADALSRGSRHRLGALPRADLCRHRLATDRPIVRHARSHRAVALELPEPRGRRSLPARPASRPRAPGRRSSGKRSHPLSRLARGDRRAPFPPRPTLRGRACLAGSPTLYHRPRRSRILASPPRRLPAR